MISITEDGSAFVQIISESLKLLKSFLAEASQELATDQEKYCLRYTSDLVGNKIFLAKCATDGQWHRVLVVRVISEEEVSDLMKDECFGGKIHIFHIFPGRGIVRGLWKF